MSTAQRIAIVVVTVIVLVGGFVLARGSGDDGTQTSDGTETSKGTGGAQAPATTTETGETQTQTQDQAPPPRVETIRIRDGQPASGEARTLRYDSGETVRLRFSSNAAAEIHIHGYDRYVQVPAGGSARTRFEADAEGIFEVEDHGTGAPLANLEVRP